VISRPERSHVEDSPDAEAIATKSPDAPRQERSVARLHALDSLRGFAMLLGIVYHASLFYSTNPDDLAGIEKSHHVAFDGLIGVIHGFRMQLFFVIAGFLSSLIHERVGSTAFIRNRARRIVPPFVASMILLNPLTNWSTVYLWDPSQLALRLGADAPPTFLQILSVRATNTGIYWFLYYLLLCCVGAATLVGLGTWMNLRMPRRLSLGLGRVVGAPWAPFALALPTASLFVQSPEWTSIGQGESLVPDPVLLAYYGLFFALGWALQSRRPAIDANRTRYRGHFLAIVPVAVAVVSLVRFGSNVTDPSSRWLHFSCATAYSLGTWAAIFGLLGFASRFLESPRPAVRYLADASYWIYLVHMPIVVGLVWLLAPLPLHCFVKFSLVVTATSAAAVASYHLLVRDKLIARFLNGRPMIVARD
jgi:glucans biosynthesis protein C